MIRSEGILADLMGLFLLLGLFLSHVEAGGSVLQFGPFAGAALFAIGGLVVFGCLVFRPVSAIILAALLAIVVHFGAYALISELGDREFVPGGGFWCLVIAAWLGAWILADMLSAFEPRDANARRLIGLAVPFLFGVWLLVLWELIVRGFGVPTVLLPPPSMIMDRFASSTSILWADFRQTYLKAVIAGFVMGCGSGFVVAILVDRIPFLRKGLLPVGNLVSALPVVGIAPIMVMWFGFDWPSKAAVVIVMTFFPMLVNTVAGLAASGAMERDLMRTYASNYWQTLFKLRLPAALPFIFNALKINSTLALIGAIVAEFFGTPIVGMGFRISTEIGRMNVDMVWAEIVLAAIAGSLSYGLLALVERTFTFWHPSYRN